MAQTFYYSTMMSNVQYWYLIHFQSTFMYINTYIF